MTKLDEIKKLLLLPYHGKKGDYVIKSRPSIIYNTSARHEQYKCNTSDTNAT